MMRKCMQSVNMVPMKDTDILYLLALDLKQETFKNLFKFYIISASNNYNNTLYVKINLLKP